MEDGTGNGLPGRPFYSSEIRAASFPPLIDEERDSQLVNHGLLGPSNVMDSGLSPSYPRLYGELAKYSRLSAIVDNPPQGESLASIRTNRFYRNPSRQLSPRSHGGPQGNGNYGAAMIGNLKPGQYVQHSSLISSALVDGAFSFLNYPRTARGLRQGKQPEDNGKDHEGAGDRRPAPNLGRAFVQQTDTTPPDAFPTGSEITLGDPCFEQTVVGAKPPARSLSKRGRKQCPDKSTNNKVRNRSEDWSEFEDQILLSVKKRRSTIGCSKKPGESWSWRASEVLEESGYERTQTACQQRWDTLLKHFKSIDQVSKRGLQPPPAFKNLALYHLMQTITGVHEKQQSPENGSCSSGQTVDASAPLSQETQAPIDSSHDPHMIEMIRHVVLRAIEGMEENLKSSQNAWMAAFSARLDVLWQEVETIKEMHLVGENLSTGGSHTKVVADAVASRGEEHHAHRRLPNQDASPNSTFWSDLPDLDAL